MAGKAGHDPGVGTDPLHDEALARFTGIEAGSGAGDGIALGRGQTQLLASMFHPDAPNDIAPSAYNEPTPAGDLPGSPLPAPSPAGFRWA